MEIHKWKKFHIQEIENSSGEITRFSQLLATDSQSEFKESGIQHSSWLLSNS